MYKYGIAERVCVAHLVPCFAAFGNCLVAVAVVASFGASHLRACSTTSNEMARDACVTGMHGKKFPPPLFFVFSPFALAPLTGLGEQAKINTVCDDIYNCMYFFSTDW